MKTKDRILKGALDLFNEEGATIVSAVDIASALSISPGHLYYHFKGKAELIAALFDIYEEELALVLEAAFADLGRPGADLQAMWTHIEILIEEAHDVRFLFREAGALALLLPPLAPRYRRVLAAHYGAAAHMLAALAEQGAIEIGPEARDGAARAIATGLFYKLAQFELEGDQAPPRERIARAAAEIMLIVAPFAA